MSQKTPRFSIVDLDPGDATRFKDHWPDANGPGKPDIYMAKRCR